MVKKVFYVEKEKFLRSMMEFALRAKKAEIYTVETLQDNLYLLHDLTPDLIIFDVKTCETTPVELAGLYAYAEKEKAKLIATIDEEYATFKDPRVGGILAKPIAAHHLAEKLLEVIDQNTKK